MKLGLTNNQLKVIAMVAMLLDHIGACLLPQVRWLRIVGRLAYPIFAYMIAEGCRHTKSRVRYLLQMGGLAAVCQLVDYIVTGSLYQCILVTFTLSIVMIYAIDQFRKHKGILSGLLALIVFGGVIYACYLLPAELPNTDYHIDYGFLGIMLPVILYLVSDKQGRVFAAAAMLAVMSGRWGNIQWYGLAAVPLLMLYNEQRGKAKLKYLFYIFYPAHMVAIYLVSQYLL